MLITSIKTVMTSMLNNNHKDKRSSKKKMSDMPKNLNRELTNFLKKNNNFFNKRQMK